MKNVKTPCVKRLLKIHCASEGGGGGVGVLPYLQFRLQVYESVGISLVEVYKKIGKSVIWVCETAQKS